LCICTKEEATSVDPGKRCIRRNGDTISALNRKYRAWKDKEEELEEAERNHRGDFEEEDGQLGPGEESFLEQLKVDGQRAKELLEEMCHPPMDNAFASMDLLGHRHDINGMTPPELMHNLLLSGLLAYCLAMFFAQVTNAVQLAIDRFVDEYIVPHRFSRRADYPHCNFAKGYCNLKEITSEEVAGKVFVWTIIQAMPWLKNLKQQFARNRSNLFRT